MVKINKRVRLVVGRYGGAGDGTMLCMQDHELYRRILGIKAPRFVD